MGRMEAVVIVLRRIMSRSDWCRRGKIDDGMRGKSLMRVCTTWII